MDNLLIPIVVAVVVVLVVIVELTAAVLPVLIVITLVPPQERQGLAEVIAAIDSSKRLRLWRALRASVLARRAARRVPRRGASPARRVSR